MFDWNAYTSRNKPDKGWSTLMPLVNEECPNHTNVGPFKIEHYCSDEPRETRWRCRLTKGIWCQRFEERVLPLFPEYRPEWDLLNNRNTVPTEATRKCACGKGYVPKSNRQRMCPACAEKNRKKLNRENQRKLRDKQRGHTVTLSA